jgi:hypothetical protein
LSLWLNPNFSFSAFQDVSVSFALPASPQFPTFRSRNSKLKSI